MDHARDTQRTKMYRAERTMKSHREDLMGLRDAELFAFRVVDSDLFKSLTRPRWHSIGVRVTDGRARQSACAVGKAEIRLPRWARSKLVILHELAHIAMARAGHEFEAAHGWRFCSTQLRLVRRFMGVAAHDELRAAFREHKVKYKEPRKLSPEALARMRERGLALAAAKRARA